MEKKIEKVRQFYTALAQGDFETVGALLSDDLVWHQPGQGALSGTYNGKQNVFAHLERMAQLSRDLCTAIGLILFVKSLYNRELFCIFEY